MTINNAPVLNCEQLPGIIKKHNVKLAALCVPASVAQDSADRLVAHGVNSILTLAKVRLSVPSHVYVQHMQFICSFMQLAYMSQCSNKR